MLNTPERGNDDKDNKAKTDLETVKIDEPLDENLAKKADDEIAENSAIISDKKDSNTKTELDIVAVDEPLKTSLDKNSDENVVKKLATTSHEKDNSHEAALDIVAVGEPLEAPLDNNLDKKVSEKTVEEVTDEPASTSDNLLSADTDTKDETPKPAHVTTGSSLTPKGRLAKTPKLIANGQRAFAWYLLSLIVLGLDQWTKWLAETKLTFHEPVPVIEPFLNWTLAYNYGAAFSFLADAGGWQKWFFSGLALVMSLFFVVYLTKVPRQAKLLSIGLALLLGGAVGNLIDRLLHGHVIDFIHIHYADVWNYPIFNIADMAICIGVLLIIIDMIFLENKRSR